MLTYMIVAAAVAGIAGIVLVKTTRKKKEEPVVKEPSLSKEEMDKAVQDFIEMESPSPENYKLEETPYMADAVDVVKEDGVKVITKGKAVGKSEAPGQQKEKPKPKKKKTQAKKKTSTKKKATTTKGKGNK